MRTSSSSKSKHRADSPAAAQGSGDVTQNRRVEQQQQVGAKVEGLAVAGLMGRVPCCW